MRRVFVRFLEEIEDSKKALRNYLTFKSLKKNPESANVSTYLGLLIFPHNNPL